MADSGYANSQGGAAGPAAGDGVTRNLHLRLGGYRHAMKLRLPEMAGARKTVKLKI